MQDSQGQILVQGLGLTASAKGRESGGVVHAIDESDVHVTCLGLNSQWLGFKVDARLRRGDDRW